MYIKIPPRQTYGKEPFAFWEDFLTDEEINYLRDHPIWKEKEVAKIGGKNNSDCIDMNVRQSHVSWLEPDNENFLIFNKITSAIAEVNRKYFHFDLDGCYEPAQMTYYDSTMSGHYDWHTDSSASDATVPRKLSMSLLLNDPSEFVGGDLQAMPASSKVETFTQKRGRAWFFPSYMLHRVSPVVLGKRKSLVLWIGGPEFR